MSGIMLFISWCVATEEKHNGFSQPVNHALSQYPTISSPKAKKWAKQKLRLVPCLCACNQSSHSLPGITAINEEKVAQPSRNNSRECHLPNATWMATRFSILKHRVYPSFKSIVHLLHTARVQPQPSTARTWTRSYHPANPQRFQVRLP